MFGLPFLAFGTSPLDLLPCCTTIAHVSAAMVLDSLAPSNAQKAALSTILNMNDYLRYEMGASLRNTSPLIKNHGMKAIISK